jgi:PIN domain
MKIVLDTCIVFKDFLMKGTEFARLIDYIEGTGARLVIPRIVRQEILKKYRDELVSFSSQAGKLARKRDGLFISFEMPPVLDRSQIDQHMEQYETWLESDLMKRSYVEDSDYSELSIEELANEAVRSTKPGGDTVHFKDLLVWRAVMSSVATFGEVCFITENYHDFAEGKDNRETLHEELTRQLGDKQRHVRLFSGLASFLGAKGPQVSGVNIEWFKQLNVCDSAVQRINDRIWDHEEDWVRRTVHGVSGILSMSLGALATTPKFLIAQEKDHGEISITTWFESKYEVSYKFLDELKDQREIPVGEGMTSRSLLTTASFKKIGDEVRLVEMALPFDW